MFKVINVEQSTEWDEIVKSFSDYDVYWLSGYVKAFQIHGDGKPLLFFYEDDSVRGINVVMKRDIALENRFSIPLSPGEWFDFATPYGYGGWIIEGEEKEDLFTEYFAWCRDNRIVSEFVRFHPVVKNYKFSDGYYDVIPMGNTVNIDVSDKEGIWTHFITQNRNKIRKAINSGVQIKQGMTRELFESFREIYNATMDKDGVEDYYYFGMDFYDSVLNDLKENATIFYATLEKEIIAASIMIYANGKLNYHLSGSIKEYLNYAPTNLLLYKAAEWANEQGMNSFHLGGGVGSEEDSLFKFKRSFYRLDDLPRFYIGQKVINEHQYEKLVNLRMNLSIRPYFPKYRA